MPSEYLLTNARLWTHEYFDVLDVPVEHVDVRWDRRFKKRIAMAYLTETEARIRLSTFLYPRLLPRQRVEVIAHEVCHVAAWVEHGTDIESHGNEWCELMAAAGFPASSGYMVVDSNRQKGEDWWPAKQV